MKTTNAIREKVLWVLVLAAGLAGFGPAPVFGESTRAEATFAGGCFWCMEGPFDKLDGVLSTTSGYTAGHVADPTYEQVSSGTTGHTEAVRIVYDPSKIGYERLLEVFWRNIDPLDGGGQFCDRGSQYRSGVYYHDEEQKALAEKSLAAVAERFDKPIATEIEALDRFYPAEDYHQNYYRENPFRYKFYRASCGRDNRLEELWGKEAGGHAARTVDELVVSAAGPAFAAAAGPEATGVRREEPEDWRSAQERVERVVSGIRVDGRPLSADMESYDPEKRVVHPADAEVPYPLRLSREAWRERLSGERFHVLREEGTERAFSNPMHDNKKKGIYYSAATGQPLFRSADKYDSGTGWPSFTQPIRPLAVAYVWDTKFFSRRIEVVDSLSGSHLGHVFADGPAPTGQRYCMNAAALIFVPEGGKPPELLLPE